MLRPCCEGMLKGIDEMIRKVQLRMEAHIERQIALRRVVRLARGVAAQRAREKQP